MTALFDRFDPVIDHAAQTADSVADAAEEQLDALEEGDLINMLPTAHQATVANQMPFVKEDCARLSPDQLIARLRSVLDGGTPAQRYLWSRYAGFKLEEQNIIAHQRGRPAKNFQQREVTAGLIEQLRDQVRGEPGRQVSERAKGERDRARRLRRMARDAYDQAHEVKRR
jgi:hypothetical protein